MNIFPKRSGSYFIGNVAHGDGVRRVEHRVVLCRRRDWQEVRAYLGDEASWATLACGPLLVALGPPARPEVPTRWAAAYSAEPCAN